MFNKVVFASRVLLGLMFTVFGLNGVLLTFTGAGFIPMPPQPPEMVIIMNGFMATKYLMKAVFICQLTSGLFFLSNFFVNAALILLGPVLINILGIHLFVEPHGLPMAIVILLLYLVVLKSRWNHFKPLTLIK